MKSIFDDRVRNFLWRSFASIKTRRPSKRKNTSVGGIPVESQPQALDIPRTPDRTPSFDRSEARRLSYNISNEPGELPIENGLASPVCPLVDCEDDQSTRISLLRRLSINHDDNREGVNESQTPQAVQRQSGESNHMVLTPELSRQIVDVINGSQALLDGLLSRNARVDFLRIILDKVRAQREALQDEILSLDDDFVQLPLRTTFEKMLELKSQRTALFEGLKLTAKLDTQSAAEYDVQEDLQVKRCAELNRTWPALVAQGLTDKRPTPYIDTSLPFDESLLEGKSKETDTATRDGDCERSMPTDGLSAGENKATGPFPCKSCPWDKREFDHKRIAYTYLLDCRDNFAKAGGEIEELAISESRLTSEGQDIAVPEEYREELQRIRDGTTDSEYARDEALQEFEEALQHARSLGLLVDNFGDAEHALPEDESTCDDELPPRFQEQDESIEFWKSEVTPEAAQEENVDSATSMGEVCEWEGPEPEIWDSISMISDPIRTCAEEWWEEETAMADYRAIGTVGDSSPVAHLP